MNSFDIARLVLRLSIGITTAIHGYSKLFLGGRIAGTSKWFTSLGVRQATFHAWLVAITEIAAGIALAAGLLTPLASAAFVALMLVAAWTVHRKNGVLMTSGGWEYTFVLAAATTPIAITGPGHMSLDWIVFGAPLFQGLPGLFIWKVVQGPRPGVKAAAGIGLVMRLPLIKILEAFAAPNYSVLHRGRDVVVAHSVGKADRDRGCW